MISILGDIHGDFSRLEALSKRGTLIQVGDFGIYSDRLGELSKLKLENPLYFIDGNHEDHELIDWIMDNKCGGGLFYDVPNLHFIGRGRSMTIEGYHIGFLGGAASVDKAIRLRQRMHWSRGEVVTPDEAAGLAMASPFLDILITHTPPNSVIQRNFDQTVLETVFGLPRTWIDPTAVYVDLLHAAHLYPPLFCGHMHRSVYDGAVRILNIDEVVDLRERPVGEPTMAQIVKPSAF